MHELSVTLHNGRTLERQPVRCNDTPPNIAYRYAMTTTQIIPRRVPFLRHTLAWDTAREISQEQV